MKKIAILLLIVSALALTITGCKKKTKIQTPKAEIVETFDIEEIAAYQNPEMTKELM